MLVLFLLSGCPYSSTVPLASPSEPADAILYGKWIYDSWDDNPQYYQIEKVDGVSFILDKYTWDSESESYILDTKYTGWFTTMEDVRFLNIEDVDNLGIYYFYKLEMSSPDTFILHEVTDNIDEEFHTSQELYDFFDTYKNLSFFYNSEIETYNRE